MSFTPEYLERPNILRVVVLDPVNRAKKAARAMAPEPPPTQPYYERRVALTLAATLLRRCRRGGLHQVIQRINRAIAGPRMTWILQKWPEFRDF